MSQEPTQRQPSMALLSSNRTQLILARNSTYAQSGLSTRDPSRRTRGDYTPGSSNKDLALEGSYHNKSPCFSQAATPLKQMLEEVRKRKHQQFCREGQLTDILQAKISSSCELETEEVQPRQYTDEGAHLPTLEGAEVPSNCCHGLHCNLL